MFFAEPGRLDAFVRAADRRRVERRRSTAAALARDRETRTASSRSGSPTASASREIDWAQTRDADGSAHRLHQRRGARRVPARLSERVRQVHRPAAARRRRRERGAARRAEDAPDKKDLGRNGTYLVMRQLRQDVRGVLAVRRPSRPAAIAQRAETLAAAMVGRTRAGDPLAAIAAGRDSRHRSKPDSVRQNQFTFDDDPAGVALPVRRAHPPRESAQHRLPRTPDRAGEAARRRWASAARASATT